MNIDYLRRWLIEHEGVRAFPYRDTVGKLTIGVGRNLDDNGLSDDEIHCLLENDIDTAMNELEKQDWYNLQPESVQLALINMCFNLGITRLLGFKKMIAALRDKNYLIAAEEALDSKWASQVKGRAVEVANMIRNEDK